MSFCYIIDNLMFLIQSPSLFHFVFHVFLILLIVVFSLYTSELYAIILFLIELSILFLFCYIHAQQSTIEHRNWSSDRDVTLRECSFGNSVICCFHVKVLSGL